MTHDKPRTLLAFDFGLRRIGVAIGQEVTGSTRPLTTLQSKQQQPDWDGIARLLETWQPDALVIGVPYHMDGSEHEMTDAARRFGRQLHGRFRLPVFEMDERLSSYAAEAEWAEERAAGKRKKAAKGDIDQRAAQIILESWLTREKNKS